MQLTIGPSGRAMAGALSACALATVAFAVPAEGGSLPSKRRIQAMKFASGTFEVKMTPAGTGDTQDGVTLSRFVNEKSFSGDLTGTSRGEMTTATTEVEDSAGYVLIERVTGSLAGRTGSFALQHSSIVAKGVPTQSILVVPASGSGGLKGLSGEMTVDVSAGKHFYKLRYSLPD